MFLDFDDGLEQSAKQTEALWSSNQLGQKLVCRNQATPIYCGIAMPNICSNLKPI